MSTISERSCGDIESQKNLDFICHTIVIIFLIKLRKSEKSFEAKLIRQHIQGVSNYANKTQEVKAIMTLRWVFPSTKFSQYTPQGRYLPQMVAIKVSSFFAELL